MQNSVSVPFRHKHYSHQHIDMAGVVEPSAPDDQEDLFDRNVAELVSKVELHVSCGNLRDRDILSKSDPMVVMFQQIRHDDVIKWVEMDRTEIIKDDLNPSFVKSFIVNYHFEEQQKLKFEVQ